MKKFSLGIICLGLVGCLENIPSPTYSSYDGLKSYDSEIEQLRQEVFLKPSNAPITKILTLTDESNKKIYNGCVYQDLEKQTLNFIKSNQSGTGWQVNMKTGEVTNIERQPVLSENDTCNTSNHGVMTWTSANEENTLKIFNPQTKDIINVDFSKFKNINYNHEKLKYSTDDSIEALAKCVKNINKDNSWFSINHGNYYNKNNIYVYNLESTNTKPKEYIFRMFEINLSKDPIELETVYKKKLSYTPNLPLKDLVYYRDHHIIVMDKDKKNEINSFRYATRFSNWTKLIFGTHQGKMLNYDINQIVMQGVLAVIYEEKSSSIFSCGILMQNKTHYFQSCNLLVDFSNNPLYSFKYFVGAYDDSRGNGRTYFYGTDSDGSPAIFQIKN